jgi:TrpR-related protein YerC/YecD
MTTFHLNDLPKEKRIQMIGEFYDIIDSLKDRSEVRLFFKSLLTADEIATLMRRVEIAILLHSKFTYDQIVDILGVGRAKVASVHKCLLQDDSGYKIITERLIKNRKERLKRIKNTEKESRKNLSPLESIKKFSPANRVLPDLLDAVIEKLEDDKELEKEAVLYTPSAAGVKKPKNK